MDPDFQEIAREIILDHSQHPRNVRKLTGPHVSCNCGQNPNCGDEYTVCLDIDHGIINDIAFTGEGCALSKASVSIMTERLKGKSLEDFKQEYERVYQLITQPSQNQTFDQYGELLALSGVRDYPQRVICAMLGWNIVKGILTKKS